MSLVTGTLGVACFYLPADFFLVEVFFPAVVFLVAVFFCETLVVRAFCVEDDLFWAPTDSAQQKIRKKRI